MRQKTKISGEPDTSPVTRGSAPSTPSVSASATSPADDVALSSLRGLGPKSAEALAQVGIVTAKQPREAGSVGARVKLVRSDVPVSLNMLWALEGALSDRDWRVVAREDRLSLLTELERCGICT